VVARKRRGDDRLGPSDAVAVDNEDLAVGSQRPFEDGGAKPAITRLSATAELFGLKLKVVVSRRDIESSPQ